MNIKRQVMVASVIGIVLVFSAVLILHLTSKSAVLTVIPAYYEHPPAQLPAVINSKSFSDSETRDSYRAAADNPKLFAQLPCYCYCDRSAHHKSLLSCFTNSHGSQCSVCRREALFASAEAKRGTPAQEIRQKIIKGLWAGNADRTK